MKLSICLGYKKTDTKTAGSTVNWQNAFGNQFGLKNINIFESTDTISKKIIQNINESLCIKMFTTTLLITGENLETT